MDPPQQRRHVLIVGGGLAGLAAARELRRQFRVTVVDAKEYFEFTSGILRAYCDPTYWDSLTFIYHEVLERNFGIGFIWGEVVDIDSQHRCIQVKSMFAEEIDVVQYDFCVIAGGCDRFQATGESPWIPNVHDNARERCEKTQLDERYLEGRRRHILEEHQNLKNMNQQHARVLVVSAGFMGVEWACELQHFFPSLRITLSDLLPRCLGPLPEDAAKYCEEYMRKKGIKTQYGVKYDRQDNRGMDAFEKTYMLSGVKHSNTFMPAITLSEKGPGGGGWIMINHNLQVIKRHRHEVWGDGLVFAVGDCIVGCVGEAPHWEMPPVPKTGYPAEQQAVHACRNIRALDREWYGGTVKLGCFNIPHCLGHSSLHATWYPWGAGIFAISLGPKDGCVVVGVSDKSGSGRVWSHGLRAVMLKELIGTTKIAQCRGDHVFSQWLWYLMHHWPVNLYGHGPMFST